MLDDTSAGLAGINARGLRLAGSTVDLTGKDIGIGQVETGRPASPAIDPRTGLKFDKSGRTDVAPTGVFLRDKDAQPDKHLFNGHAENVAGVMIRTGGTNNGVSPGAKLYASAHNVPSGDGQAEAAVSLQKVALQNGGDVRAINYSAGEPQGGKRLDGSSLLTQFIDWSARAHETLYVVAGYQEGGAPPVPKDEFNGLTVGLTKKDTAGTFRQVDQTNVFLPLAGGRRSIDLVAPGRDIVSPKLGSGTANALGTSFAAPHVTAAVALLQEAADQRRSTNTPGWASDNPRRHEVMKAVLMNSADKVQDVGDGLLLGMEKTITKKANPLTSWFDSDARDAASNPGGRKLPLDKDMGTGQLNVKRALTQFSSGEVDPTIGLGTVPPVGWDFGSARAGIGEVTRYRLGTLKGNSYVSITLVWDRNVYLLEPLPDRNGLYEPQKGETFKANPPFDLNLYLVAQGEGKYEKRNLWSSVSAVDNVEHIFFKLPARDAAYDIVIDKASPGEQDYALAWWAAAGTPPPVRPGKVGSRVWADLNGNGIQDGSEPGVAYVPVDLYDIAGNWLDTTTTDENGSYEFSSLDPGSYYVVFTNPIGYGFTIPNAGSDDALDSDADLTGRTTVFTIGDGEDLTVDAGLITVPPGSIGDDVWNDANGNGLRDSGEAGLADVPVYLYKDIGTFMDVVSTDASGHYLFPSVEPGSYYLIFGQPYGYHFTLQNQGADATIDSDADPATGQTAVFTVAVGESESTIDAGLVADPPVAPATIGDYVWQDANGNGIQDSGEPGLAGVPVWLCLPDDTPIDFTMTDASGHYSFSEVDPGDYYLAFGKPYGFEDSYDFSPQGQGTDNTRDSDADSTGTTGIFTVAAGEVKTSLDAGLVFVPGRPASVGDFVWQDLNGNGVQDDGEPGQPGVTVRLLDAGGNQVASTTTDSNGLYQFNGLTPGTYSVQFVLPSGQQFTAPNQGGDPYFDSDADPATGRTAPFSLISGQSNVMLDAGLIPANAAVGDRVWQDTNGNGLQDAGEPGRAGVSVSLYNQQGNLVATTQTDATGAYQFTGLVAGTYSIQVTLPSDYLFSPPHQGNNDAIDSDPDMTGRTALFTLAAGESRTTIDAGLVPNPGGSTPGTIGNRVWLDTNRNGIQDTGEGGVMGVQVQLFDGLGTLIASVLTDATGQYHFTGVAPGTYYVHVVLPTGYTFSPQDQGTDDTKDSDVNTSGSTAYFTLLAGQTKDDLDAGLMPVL